MRFLVIFATIWLWAAPLAAQDFRFELFDRFATSVEKSIAEDQVPEDGFDSVRASLVDWRQTFLDGQNANSVQIETLQAQIDSLGAPPAEGETEDEAIAGRRQSLQEELQEARVPQLEAVEGYARADALIRSIDSTMRARQTDALFELQRTPLDPTLWPSAAAIVSKILADVRAELLEDLSPDGARTQSWQRVAVSGMLLVLALALIVRGPHLIESWLARIETSSGIHGRVVFGFLVSGASVVSTMVGISMINIALISTGILGEVGRSVAIGVNGAILAYALGRWLGGRTFPARENIPTVLQLTDEQRAKGRVQASALGALSGFLVFMGLVTLTVDIPPEERGVLTFPVFVLMSITFYRIGHLITEGGLRDEDDAPVFSNSLVRLLGRALRVLAVVAPIIAAVGYFNFASGLLLPVSASLGLIALLMAVHYFLRAGYAMLRGLDDDSAKQALAPVLASLLLTVASAPLFAMLFGARNSDISEIWAHFKNGVRFGGTTISPGNILTLAIVFAVGFGLTRLIQGTLRNSVLPRTHIDKGGQNAIVSGIGYVGLTIAAIIAVTSAGIDLSSLAIIVGALGVGIGFGLQNIVNNFVSGIILLIERPISEGDWVEVNGNLGIVKSISVRSTRIEMFDRTDVIVPNGDLISGTVTNWTHGNSAGRIILTVGVAYGTDTRKVESILRAIAEAHPLVAVNPPPNIVFQGFGADSLDFEIRIILNDIAHGLVVRTEINHEIVKRFTEEGIEIPFAQRDLWIRNAEVLRAPPDAGTALPTRPSDVGNTDLDQDGEPD
ncbi:MAG: DUF3772 domain-containing protein [Silicimonas sp.]|nr:DUF3772 domain-containing protein [Silicimonas sp.]